MQDGSNIVQPATEGIQGKPRSAALGFLLVASLAAALLVTIFFSPQFVVWQRLDYPEAWSSPEINRAIDTWRKVQYPFTWNRSPTNQVINWRLLFPLLAHFLHLPRVLFFAIPHLGCLLVLGIACHIVYRESGSRRQAFQVAVIVGTTSWFFVSTGWLTYFDSWYILGLLVASFYRSYWALFLCSLLVIWVDERFVLTIPLVMVVRAVNFRWVETDDWPSFWRSGAILAAVTLPYVVMRLLVMSFKLDPTSGRHIGTVVALKQDVEVVAWGAWHGLRGAWLLVGIFLWYSFSKKRRLWTFLVWLGVVGTAVLHIKIVAGDLSRTMSALVPAALMGAILLLRCERSGNSWSRWWQLAVVLVWSGLVAVVILHASSAEEESSRTLLEVIPLAIAGVILLYRCGPATSDCVLVGVMLLNLLLPARHVIATFEVPIHSFSQECREYAQAARYDFRDPDFHVQRAIERMQANQLAAALDDCNTALSLDSKRANAYNVRGLVYFREGELTAARNDLDAAIGLKPKFGEAYLNRACVRQRQNDVDGALEDFKQTLRLMRRDWPDRAKIEKEVGRLESGRK